MKIKGRAHSLLFAWLFCMGGFASSAQTLQTLYAFVSTNGCNPQAPLTVGADGNFYGTTPTGGTNGGYGTIFKVTTNGVLTSLFQFSVTNGENPYAGLALGKDGGLYGTTEYGGSYGKGTIFRITAAGDFTSLVSFNLTNGANPTANLTLGPDGAFYGTTVFGGSGYGVVFKVSTNGALTKLASFTSAYQSRYGGQNTSALIFGADGALYGTTAYGGTSGDGSVFRVTTNGALSVFVPEINLNGEGNAYAPSLTLGKDGNFYGIICYGGTGEGGAIYKITPGGYLTDLYSFYAYSPYSSGIYPRGNLVLGNDGWLYGTTMNGGTNGGFGTVFKISTAGSFSSLASFGFTNGASPYAGLVLGNDGNFYGASYGGGDCGEGAVFEMTTNGTLNELAPFPGSPGCWPKAGLTLGKDRNFYGTTSSGGTNGGFGTLFQFTTNGDFSSLASFAFTNGASPVSDLTAGVDGNLYGTTSSGGFGGGTVFVATLDGEIRTISDFSPVSYEPPYSALVQGTDGAFYGTARNGGTGNGYGSIFSVTTGGFMTNILFFGYTNGANPAGGLCFGTDGNIYGTTSSGSAEGTVFRMTTNGDLTTLKTFANNSGNGELPYAGLSLANDGSLYGTTSSGGGITNSFFPFGCGEIFKVAGNGVVSGVAPFDSTNGIQPEAALLAASDGNLYGTAMFGGFSNSVSGVFGFGTVFRATPKGGITPLILFNGINGQNPQTDLTVGADGNLYGTTTYGGIGGNGTIFRVLLPPDVALPPQSQTNIAGASASFTVGATSLKPMAYQWQRNGTNLIDGGDISGTETTNLVISGISDSDAGVYYVIVSNADFAVTNSAALTVIDPPGISGQPADQRVLVGNVASFSVVATNPPPLHYQWRFDSTNILGATNAVFAIQAAALTNDGYYSVIVTNLAGSVTSSNALLAVVVSPSLELQFSSGSLFLSLNGMLSNNFVVQYNTNLSGGNWQTLLSLSNLLTSPYQFFDPDGAVSPARFYRVLMQ